VSRKTDKWQRFSPKRGRQELSKSRGSGEGGIWGVIPLESKEAGVYKRPEIRKRNVLGNRAWARKKFKKKKKKEGGDRSQFRKRKGLGGGGV